MNTRYKLISLTSLTLLGALTLAGCSAANTDTATTESQSSSATQSSQATTTKDNTATQSLAEAPSGPNSQSASSVTTEAQLISLIQSAYGEAQLGLHRGHKPVESTLNTVLGISHEELHVRMDSGQNLATVANEVGVGQEALITALVDSWSGAIDNLESAGTITADQADKYLAALTEAFTFKVTWNGSDATPTFSGI